MKSLRTREEQAPGQDSGHGFTWGDYIASLVEEHGTLAAVAQKLARTKLGGGDPLTIERGLRRLRTRGQRDGGEYGRALLRVFGISRGVLDATRWMGVYHTRFADLPVSLCHEQLRLWDKPPASESAARAFVQLGFASVALRRGDLDSAEAHLSQAKPFVRTDDAKLEHALVTAYVAQRRGDPDRAGAILRAAERLLALRDVTSEERACFRSRWLDQRAYLSTHFARDLETAHELYLQIEPVVPFAACRRALGLAYVAWKKGEIEDAVAEARAACDHAGDGGFLRLRVIALNLLFHITRDERIRERAASAARSMEDEALVLRILGADQRLASSS